MPRGNEDANKRQRQKAAQTIRNICDSIGSEKIKERQEGIESLKTVFSDPNILRNFGVTEKGSSDTKAWLSLFQSLFKCVLQEKAGATKKTTQSMAAAERRLTEAARTVRWMIEKTRHMMGKKVTTPIHDHLCQTMIHKGALLGPVVLDYVKALESLLTFRPHLEHLKSTQWVELVELSFNVILGDNLKTTFSEDDDLNTTESAAPSPAPTDNMGDMYDDDSAMDVDVDGDGGTPRPKKRRRAETPQPTAPTQPSTSYRPPRSSNNRIAVTPEQVAFTSLLATLMSSPYAPFNSQDDPYITSSVLSRLLRFLQLYPTDTTLHHDFLRILTHTIDHISYNNTALMTTFARKSWDSLVKLWAPKNKNLKEGLISVYRILFPFLTSGHGSAVNQYSEMLWNLWNVLSVEGDSKWGLDVLSIESLRLELSQRPTDRREAFVAKVFRAGDNFDRHQAMMWAILELQADCAEKLYRHSESVHSLSTPSRPTQSYGKRARIENPLSTVLASIRTQTSPNARIYHLQILLFFIDSHWGVLHREMKLEVFSTLLQFISVDDKDGAVQNWIMLCFAAIASADFAASENSSYLSPVQASASFSSFLPSQALREAPASWEHVWTHAIRRTNSSALCRTACHTALAILSHPNLQSARKSFIRPPLSPQRVVADLEALLKDLDVQGPSSPYDTVCAFLSLSLRIVNQDVRIFRLQLEEKVLSWLTGFWQLNHIDALEVRLYLVKDVLLLLETICSCSKRSALLCRISLPPCLTVDTMETVERSRIIREFVLEARLPEFQPAGDRDESTRHTEAPDAEHTFPNATPSEADVIEPRAREKRISVFFSKTLESLASQWRIEMTGKPKAELAKQLLDIAVISLSFEAILYLNGIRWDKRSINAACKLIGSITPLLNEGKWTLDEKYLVLQALEPLFLTGMAVEDDPPWTAMLTARPSTGVRYELLRSLMPEHSHNTTSHYTMQHLRLLWTNFEVQGCFSTVPDMLREVLAKIISHGVEDDGKSFDADDKDGFAPIKTADKPVKSDVVGGNDGKPTTIRFVETCISFLTVVPLLQSSSGEPTRDQDLMELIINAPASVFVQTCPVLLSNVRRATLYLSGNNLDNLLDKWSEIAGDYTYSRSPQFSLLALGLADASLPLWASSAAANSDYAETIRSILTNSVSNYESKKIGWKVRDSLARLLEKYLAIDPRQEFWMAGEDVDQENLPSSVIQKMNGDEDVRVRFRVAVISARLFEFAGTIGVDPMNLYGQVRGHYSTDIESYEHIVTRILSLGNIMIVSSAVRRGPYWHLLELCFYSDMYTSHMEATLKEVAGRIGLKPFSALFEAYASQIAFSIRQAQQNVLRIPPHLLGYKDAKERAVATFRLFTPANLHGGGNARTIEHGQHLFRGHCETIQKKPEEGLWECFGDIFAHELLSGIKSRATTDHQLSPVLLQGLTSVLKRSESDIKHALREKLDSVVSSILRAIGDQDFSPNGPIRAALASAGVGAGVSDVFAKLTAYRTTADFDIHEPNLPKYDTWVVLVALTQVLHAVQVDPDALTYHVLQELFSSVESSQIVNEQLRLTNAITIWIALQHERFHSHTLLHAVVRGECSLLAQVDLARSAQSVLEWCFARYRQNAHQDARFPDVLVRVACVCCDHSKDSYNTKVLAMGADLLSWIDRQAIFISEEKGLGAQIQVALTTWPHPVPAQLDGLSSSVSIGDLSKILDEDHIPSNKFRIVQRLCQETSSGNAKSSQFAQYDFWNLKECIPSNDRLGIEDVLSFASLLLMNQGSISSFGSELLLSDSHRQLVQGRQRTLDPAEIPERSIILSLLSLLECSAAKRRNAAYRTLRALLVVLRERPDPLPVWPSQYGDEIRYLGIFDPVISTPNSRELSELNSEAFLDASKSFEGWVGKIAILLSGILAQSIPFYAQLAFILQSDASFAEGTLPILVQTLIQDTNEAKSGKPHASILSTYFSSILASKDTDIACRRCIIEIALHLRNITPNSRDALAHEKWLAIDYLLLAQNAIACGAYTTALLFLELGDDVRRTKSHTPEETALYNTAVENVMYDIYANIDEPDGFYGIKTQNYHQFLMKRFHHEQQWEKAFRFHGAALEANTKNISEAEGLLQSFHSYGFDHLATSTLLNTVAPQKPNLALNYQLGWRTETWDLPDLEDDHCSDASLYHALRAIHREREHDISATVVKDVLLREMDHLRSLGSENVAQIRETTRNLMSLSQITSWMSHPNKTPHNVPKLFLDPHVIESDFQFDDICSIMSTRISLLRSARHREERQQIGSLRSSLGEALLEAEKSCLLQLSCIAREARHSQIALNSVTRAKELEYFPSVPVSEEYASVLWSHQEEKLAVDLLKDVRANFPKMGKDDVEAAIQKASLNACLGTWTAEACLEKHSTIWEECFAAAIALLQSTSHQSQAKARASVYHKAAIFAERQYYAIVRSSDAIRWRVYTERKRKEIEELEAHAKRTKEHSEEWREIKKLIQNARKVKDQDQQANEQHNQDRRTYLQHAIDMYSRCLEESDSFDQDTPIRLCSLWLANFEETKLRDQFKAALDRVPSRKLVFLAHQLTARLSADSSTQKILQRLILRMSLEHPFHSLYQLLLLSPPREDVDKQNASRRSSGRQSVAKSPSPGTPNERTNAAKAILGRLRSDSSRQERLLAIEQLCFASLEWADYPIKNKPEIKTGQNHVIPSELTITKLTVARLKVPVITVHTPIDPTMRYEDCIWVDKYHGKYTTAGGLSKPKICSCRGSDGKYYKQLFKGEQSDDLRQDAVMEQVFQLVNTVLQRDPETRRRQLRVRDYKVIPLDTRAGVLEFVDNTITLKNWLGSAHPRYRPQDRKDIVKWWSTLSEKNGRRETHPELSERLRIYRETRDGFKPVMRYWFTEKHKVPISWFGMRLNYTRSVATTSIVGHVLGLGDRHTSNILLDSISGEVVHIDLGVAFDQAKLLPVPELVPFRMTEDMEDGMGMSGTEGVFQRCAEETMRVLREDSEVIMTVLEVFRHDPLYTWTITDTKIQKIQQQSEKQAAAPIIPGLSINMASGNAEENADRALSSVARKLDKTLSVATVVRGLVAEAKDPANLASLYHGWGPYY